MSEPPVKNELKFSSSAITQAVTVSYKNSLHKIYPTELKNTVCV